MSFVFLHADVAKKIRAVYVFGSAVRGELHKQSDIDLFVEAEEKDELLVKQTLDSAMVRFSSSKDFEKWKLLSFTYPIVAHVGRLDEWDLKTSIASEGIALYNKRSILTSDERFVLFSITYPVLKKEYVRLRRVLFGRDEEEYKNTGLICQVGGRRISSTVFMVPKTQQQRVMDSLSIMKNNYRMIELTTAQN